MKEEFGWAPAINFSEGIKETVKWIYDRTYKG